MGCTILMMLNGNPKPRHTLTHVADALMTTLPFRRSRSVGGIAFWICVLRQTFLHILKPLLGNQVLRRYSGNQVFLRRQAYRTPLVRTISSCTIPKICTRPSFTKAEQAAIVYRVRVSVIINHRKGHCFTSQRITWIVSACVDERIEITAIAKPCAGLVVRTRVLLRYLAGVMGKAR